MSADYDSPRVDAGLPTGVDPSIAMDAGVDPAQWIEDHGDALYRFAMVRLGDTNAAEEAVQECLLAALSCVPSFAARSSQRTWLISILKHKIVDYIRRTTRERSSNVAASNTKLDVFDDRGFWSIVPKPWHDDSSVSMERLEFRTVLLDCLGKLPAGMADAVVLREINQLPSDEVCDALAISKQTLWQRLHRARLSLRRCLELNWFDEPQKP